MEVPSWKREDLIIQMYKVLSELKNPAPCTNTRADSKIVIVWKESFLSRLWNNFEHFERLELPGNG